MVSDIEKYIEPYVYKDAPIPYKTLTIYPVLFKDVYDFLKSYDILIFDKDSIPNAEIISMSYLEFVFNVLLIEDIVNDNKNTYSIAWLDKLTNIFNLCLHINIEDVKLNTVNGRLQLLVGDTIIDADDFDDIRRIIMFQNVDEYDDSPMDEDFKKAVEQYYAIKNKDLQSPTLEVKRDVLLAKTMLNIEQINNLTFRRFERVFHTVINSLDYIISGIFTSQGANDGKLEHWVYKPKKDKYAEAFVSADKFKNKINSV